MTLSLLFYDTLALAQERSCSRARVLFLSLSLSLSLYLSLSLAHKDSSPHSSSLSLRVSLQVYNAEARRLILSTQEELSKLDPFDKPAWCTGYPQ